MAKAMDKRQAEKVERTDAQALNDAMGGRIAISGFLYQLLCSFDAGLQAVVGQLQQRDGDVTSVQMVLEPLDGGDNQRRDGSVRTVEQLKIRTTGQAWTTGDIAEEVLPDLMRAVTGDAESFETRFQFTTNEAVNCAPLLTLGKVVAAVGQFDALPDSLDDNDKTYVYGGSLTARAFFKRLVDRSKAKSPAVLGRVLAGLSIRPNVTETQLIARIDGLLESVLDYQEGAEAKRHELISRMADRARSGKPFDVQTFLAQADVHLNRLRHVSRLVASLDDRVQRHALTLGYDGQADVRPPPPLDRAKGLTVVSGESGFGKSWSMTALAQREIQAGRLAVIISHITSVDHVYRLIAERIWLTSYEQVLPLPALARRLRPAFGDDKGDWLTVFVDDVQDHRLAAQLMAEDWAGCGVRLVMSVPGEIAGSLGRARPDTALLTVPRFTAGELDALLSRNRLRGPDLPADVFELLRTPIFAKLYLELQARDWLPANEYALVDRFWRDKTAGGFMANHEDDLVELRGLALSLLEPQPFYPWPAAIAKGYGVTDAVRQRLATCGVMRKSADGNHMIHDRILNWLVAEALVERLRLGGSTDDIVQALARLMGQGEDPLVFVMRRRLGYVLMDVLWMLAQGQPAAVLADVIEAVLGAWRGQTDTSRFLEELGGLGLGVLPALELLVGRAVQQDLPEWRKISLGRAVGETAKLDPDLAAQAIARLLAKAATERAGLEACVRTPAPSLLDVLWSIHMRHQIEIEAARKMVRGDPRTRRLSALTDVTFAALTRAAKARPDWLTTQLARAQSGLAVEQLLYVLLQIDRDDGAPIWRTTKTAILGAIRPGTHAVAKAIGRFQDHDELNRLEIRTGGADGLEPVLRLVGLLQLAPARGIAQFQILRDDDIGGSSGIWLRRLYRASSSAATTALLEKYGKAGWEELRGLALTYRHEPDLVDGSIFEAILEGLLKRLAAVDQDDAWKPTGENHLIRFLTLAVRREQLQRLADQAGQSLESLLVSRIRRQPERQSLSHGLDDDLYPRLLLAIGGKGLEIIALLNIAGSTRFQRIDGYRLALRLPASPALASALNGRVQAPDLTSQETPELAVALAAHRLDDALVTLAHGTRSWFPEAMVLRAAAGPLSELVMTQLTAALSSPDAEVRQGAYAALANGPGAQTGGVLAQALSRVAPDSEEAWHILGIMSLHDAYVPGVLNILTRLSAPGRLQAMTVCLLARCGDAAAKDVAADALASLAPSDPHLAVEAALDLVDHPGAADKVAAVLAQARQDRFHRADAIRAVGGLLRLGRLTFSRSPRLCKSSIPTMEPSPRS